VKFVIGTQKTRLETDNPKIIRALRDVYSASVPGARYSPAYRMGRWDGIKHFVTNRGVFRTGLLDSIQSDLRKAGLEWEEEYKDDSVTSPNLEHIAGYSYFDYQEKAIRYGLEKQRCIIKAPTGAGKTLIMAGLVQAHLGKRIVILFNAKNLLKQTYDFLTGECGLTNVGVCFGEGYQDGEVMLATVQSIEKIIDPYVEQAEVLMVDEVHEFGVGDTTVAAIESFPNAKFRYGFTATMPTEKIPMWNLIGAFGPVFICKTTSDLVEEGVLCKPIIQMLSTEQPISEEGQPTYADIYASGITNNDYRNDQIKSLVNQIREGTPKARILILVKSLEHGEILQEALGEDTWYLQGEDDLGDRYRTIGAFTSCEGASVLIGTKILQTGVNIREITHFINARGLKSPIATIQALGRALRTHESKDKVFVYDFLDTGPYLGAHANKRYNTYKKEGHEVHKVEWNHTKTDRPERAS